MNPTIQSLMSQALALLSSINLTCTNPEIRTEAHLFAGPKTCFEASPVCRPLHGSYWPPELNNGRPLIYLSEESVAQQHPTPLKILVHELIHCARDEHAGKWGLTRPRRDAQEEQLVRAITENLLRAEKPE